MSTLSIHVRLERPLRPARPLMETTFFRRMASTGGSELTIHSVTERGASGVLRWLREHWGDLGATGVTAVRPGLEWQKPGATPLGVLGTFHVHAARVAPSEPLELSWFPSHDRAFLVGGRYVVATSLGALLRAPEDDVRAVYSGGAPIAGWSEWAPARRVHAIDPRSVEDGKWRGVWIAGEGASALRGAARDHVSHDAAGSEAHPIVLGADVVDAVRARTAVEPLLSASHWVVDVARQAAALAREQRGP